MKNCAHSKGFTLIELMIVVAIIAVLAAVSYPSYKEYVAKSRRAEAKTVLLGAQQWMERFYSENFRYDKNSANVSVTDASQFPSKFTVSPVPGQGAAVYDITVSTVSRDAYEITATPRASGVMKGDRCGKFQLDQLGRKVLKDYDTVRFPTPAEAVNYCWK